MFGGSAPRTPPHILFDDDRPAPPPSPARHPDSPGDAMLVDLAHDAIIVRDPQNRIVLWNRGAQELYGWSRREALGLVVHELLKSRAPNGGELAPSNGDSDWGGFVVNTTRDKRDVLVWTRSTVIRDAAGDVKSTLQSDRDISPTVLAHLDEAKRALERAAN
jgi:PAS domain S-box-containing protein